MTADDDPAALEQLRRRLYRPDATGSDLQQYLDGRPAPPAPPPGPTHRRRLPRHVVVGALTATVLVETVLVATVLFLRPADRAPASSPSGPPVLVSVGDGQLLDVGEGRVSRPTEVTTAVRGTPVLGRRVEGVGSAVVPLPALSGGVEGGRAVVALATESDGRVRWRALLETGRPDWSTSVLVLARGAASTPAAPSPATTFMFKTRAPTVIAVDAPRGVRWALVSAATAGLEVAIR